MATSSSALRNKFGLPEGCPMSVDAKGYLKKKHRGKVHQFGHVRDYDAALAKFNERWPVITKGEASKGSPKQSAKCPGNAARGGPQTDGEEPLYKLPPSSPFTLTDKGYLRRKHKGVVYSFGHVDQHDEVLLVLFDQWKRVLRGEIPLLGKIRASTDLTKLAPPAPDPEALASDGQITVGRLAELSKEDSRHDC